MNNDNPPAGLLSLTYHLAYDEYYRNLWLSGDYAKCFADFEITDAKLQAAISDLNNKLGTTNTTQRNSLIDQWMSLIGNDVKTGAANPNILW